MARRFRASVCTRTTMYIAAYLLVIGVLEYVIILELHGRLHMRENVQRADETLVLTQVELDGLRSWRERREGADHPVAKDRVRALEWKVSLKSNDNSKESDFVPVARPPRLGNAPERHGKTLQQYPLWDDAEKEDGEGAALQGETENLANKAEDNDKDDSKEGKDNDENEEEEEEEEEEDKDNWVFNPNDFEIIVSEDGTVEVRRKPLGPEIVVENMTLPARNLTPLEQEGGNIMLTLRSTVSKHKKRLPLLFQTWMADINCSRVFLVTDGPDPAVQEFAAKSGMHYVNAECGSNYMREQLCCKAGAELELFFQPQNLAYDWLCHVDDDMYVNMKKLVGLLSVFHPRRDLIYLGRSGSPWQKPRRVKKRAVLSKPGKKYHFAVGGMYCLSRAMMDKVKSWLGGREMFANSCSQTREPEDVTVGFIVGAVLGLNLSRTELIFTHGLHLSSMVMPEVLSELVAVSYGYGSVQWGSDPYNAIDVPNALYSLLEDESQFKSLHCYLHPQTQWCQERMEYVLKLNSTASTDPTSITSYTPSSHQIK